MANYVFRPAIALAHGQKVCYQIFILCSYHTHTIGPLFFTFAALPITANEILIQSFFDLTKNDFDTYKQNGNV